MAYYRLYLRSGSRGRFSSFDGFEAQCDASAIEHVATLNRDGARELWCGSRLVERWEQAPGVGHGLTHASPVLTSDNI